jgi:hypothetical protein
MTYSFIPHYGLESIQPLTLKNTRNLPGCSGQSACKADDLTAISEPTPYRMWEPRLHLTMVDLPPSHPVFDLKTRRFRDWILSPSLGRTYSDGPNRKRWSLSLETSNIDDG